MIWFLFLFFTHYYVCTVDASQALSLIPSEVKIKISTFLSDEQNVCERKSYKAPSYSDYGNFECPQTCGFSFNSITFKQRKFFKKHDLKKYLAFEHKYEKYTVLPDFQCWSKRLNRYNQEPFSVIIRNDTFNMKGYFKLPNWQSYYAYIKSYFQQVKTAEFYCWDAVCDESYLYAAVATSYYITFLSISNIFGLHSQKNLFSYYYDDEMKTKPSLCFHNCSGQKVVSLIHKNSMKIFSLGTRLSVNEISYPLCCTHPLCSIDKHEYIGGGTYLLISHHTLYFAEVDNSTLKCYKQTVKNKEGNESCINNFAVNHRYRTDSGRARFFIVAAGCELFLFDLLERYKDNILPIKPLKGFEGMCFDKISFVDNNIFLVRFENGCNRVNQITLDTHWALKKMLVTQQLSQDSLTHPENNTQQKNLYSFWKKLYRFFCEQWFSIITWLVGSFIVYHECNKILYYEFNSTKKITVLTALFWGYVLVHMLVFAPLKAFFTGTITPQVRSNFFLFFHLFFPLLPLKIRNYVRYGVWS